MWNIVFIMIAILAGTAEFHPPGQAQIVAGSSKAKQVSLFRGEKKANVDSEQFQVALPGKVTPVSVVLLYDSNTKLLWWYYQDARSGTDEFPDILSQASFTYESDKEIVNWRWSSSPPRLWVLKSSKRCETMADCRANVLACLQNLHGELQARWSESFREIELGKYLTPEFLQLKGSVSPARHPTLRKVSKASGLWRVTLDGPNGDVAVILLNENYEVKDTKILRSAP